MEESEVDRPRTSHSQHVVAVGGFAYGAVGADIHVFENGLPLYLLANWKGPREANQEWLRELPSRMLNARRQVVPFTGRAAESDHLVRWRDGPTTRLAVRWLDGPGGQGKTRLAHEFAAASVAAGWKVIEAFHGPDADAIAVGSEDLTLGEAVGVLVVADYADRWLITNLTWLFKNALLHRPGTPTRVLLVARSADQWPALRAILDTHEASTSRQTLAALAEHSGERLEMFRAARSGFAGVYAIDDPAGAGPPGQIDGPDFGLTLALHMAALVAVDALATGNQPPRDVAGLTMYLLNREQLHWRRLYEDDGPAAGSGEGYRTDPDTMNRAVFVAALTGTVPRASGASLLERVGLPEPETVLRDHAVSYPPSAAGAVLEPLYPDRLAEDFLALTLPGHAADYPTQLWARDSAVAVVERRAGPDAPTPWTGRGVQFLAAAAQRWSHVGSQCLYPLLSADPQLVIDAGSAALVSLAGLDDVEASLLTAVEARFPQGRNLELDPGIAVVTRRLFEQVITDKDDETQAHWRVKLSLRSANAGFFSQALEESAEAVRVWERLVSQNRGEYLPALAVSLANLSNQNAGAGLREAALDAARQAAVLYRELAAADPVEHLPGLGAVLNTLSSRLAEMEQRREALSAAEESFEISRESAAADAASEHFLAAALTNLGSRLAEAGRPEAALAPSREAVEVYRRLAGAAPAQYLPELAAALNNVTAWLAVAGRRREALPTIEESVRVYRRLAKANPDSFEPDLAMALNNLGNELALLGRFGDAVAAGAEAVAIRRELARGDPAAHLPDLAMALSNLGVSLTDLGRREDAVPPSREAVEIYRALAVDHRSAHLPELAMALNNLGNRLAEVGDPHAAIALAEEAVALRRELVDVHSPAHLADLAASLNNLGARMSALGMEEEALAPIGESIGIYRELASRIPAAFEAFLSTALNNFGKRLAPAGRADQALRAVEESLAIRRRLVDAEPEAHRAALCDVLVSCGARLAELGRPENSLDITREAVDVARRLPESVSMADPSRLALAQRCFAWVRLASGLELDQAATAIDESVELYRQLAGRLPVFAVDFDQALSAQEQIRAAMSLNRSAVAHAGVRHSVAADPGPDQSVGSSASGGGDGAGDRGADGGGVGEV